MKNSTKANEVIEVETAVEVDDTIEVTETEAKTKFFDKHPKLKKGLKIGGIIAAVAAGGAAIFKISHNDGYVEGVNDAMSLVNPMDIIGPQSSEDDEDETEPEAENDMDSTEE